MSDEIDLASKPNHPGLSERDVVAALYRGALGREPDRHGLESWTEVFREAGIDVAVGRFMASQEARRKATRDRAPGDHWSLSQHGEVEALLSLICLHALPNRVLVDVGAADIRISNTADLVGTLGWRGLLIEANPELARRLAEQMTDFPVEVINCAVSTEDGDALLYLGVNEHISSLREENAASWGPVKDAVNVKMARLGPLLERHHIPHDFSLLSIDIEGLDADVFNDLILTSAYRPGWVILEWGDGWEQANLNDDRFAASVANEYELTARHAGNVILRHRATCMA